MESLMRNHGRKLADSPCQYELVLQAIGLCRGRDATEQRLNSFLTDVERQIGSLLFAHLQVFQQDDARVQIMSVPRRLPCRNHRQVLIEQRVGRVVEEAAREAPLEFQPLRFISRRDAKARAIALFGVVERALIKPCDWQQRSVKRGGFEAESAGTVGEKLEPERRRNNLMLATVEAENVIPADDTGSVHRRQRKV